tara:strand:- start:650 stop:874 length:225 start_codon:yes stop_codon:yes gene_type:complete
MSDPLDRTTTYLTEVQEEFGELINLLQSFDQDGFPITHPAHSCTDQFSVALNLVIEGAKKEMGNYSHNYMNEEI